MAVSHVISYYKEIANQYLEMRSELKDFQELAEKNIVSPERLKEIETTIKPLMDNYERLSYIIFLLNRPKKKSKEKRYDKYIKKELEKLSKSNSLEAVKAENEQVISKLEEVCNLDI